MIRVVLDSNVYISALLFGGSPRAVIELAQRRAIELFISRAIVEEIEEALREKFGWGAGEIRAAASACWRSAVAQEIDPRMHVTDCVDADDNRILECALESRAQFLVTGDRHLLALDPYRGVSILTPRQFLDGEFWAASER